MGIEPTSEAWEACNLTQETLDWRHFCNFRNALIGKQWKTGRASLDNGCRILSTPVDGQNFAQSAKSIPDVPPNLPS
jgi:hypothetical protein